MFKRRRYLRHAVNSLVYVGLDGGNGGIVLDLSEGGMGVQAVAPVPTDRPISVVLELDGKTRIDATGQVVWTDASGRTGIKFLTVDTKSRRALKDWLFTDMLITASQTLEKPGETETAVPSDLPADLVADLKPVVISQAPERDSAKAAAQPAAQTKAEPTPSAPPVKPAPTQPAKPAAAPIMAESAPPQSPRDAALALVLERAATQALFETGAVGAAIALTDGDKMVCRARSGDVAPAIGAPLNAQSGITGECVRSGATLYCHDSEDDVRVDRIVCQRLGVRSIAVAPILGEKGVLGVVEVFGVQPNAFSNRQVQALEEVARGVAAATDPYADPAAMAEARPRPAAPQAATRDAAPSGRTTPPVERPQPAPVVSRQPIAPAQVAKPAAAPAMAAAAAKPKPVPTPPPQPTAAPNWPTPVRNAAPAAPKIEPATPPKPVAPPVQAAHPLKPSPVRPLVSHPLPPKPEPLIEPLAAAIEPMVVPEETPVAPTTPTTALAQPAFAPEAAPGTNGRPSDRILETPEPLPNVAPRREHKFERSHHSQRREVLQERAPEKAIEVAPKRVEIAPLAEEVVASAKRPDLTPADFRFLTTETEPAGSVWKSTAALAAAALIAAGLIAGAWMWHARQAETEQPAVSAPAAVPQQETSPSLTVTPNESSRAKHPSTSQATPNTLTPATQQPALTLRPGSAPVQKPSDEGNVAPPTISSGAQLPSALSNATTAMPQQPPPQPVQASAPAVPVQVRSAPLLVSSAVLDEQLIDRPAPQYPDVARRTGLQGSVVLNVTIGANGRVSAVKVLRGPALLADAAVSAVSRWHYRPYTVDGKPVPVQTEVVIRFALPR